MAGRPRPRRPKLRTGDLVLLAPQKSVIPAYDGKPFVGRESVLRVSSVTGTGSARSPYRVVVTDGEHFWHLEPDDVVAQDAGSDPAAPAKSTAQLGREIRSILTEGDEGTIVVAWTEDAREIAPGQRPWRHDLGERPKLVDVKKVHAAMWLNRGGVADVDRARAYVRQTQRDTGRVFVYPLEEKDPLGRARRDVLAG